MNDEPGWPHTWPWRRESCLSIAANQLHSENLRIPGWGHCLWECAEVWLMSWIFSLSTACVLKPPTRISDLGQTLDALLVSTDRSSSVRIGAEVSPSGEFKPGTRKEVLFIFSLVFFVVFFIRHFVVVSNCKSQAGAISKVFYAQLRFGFGASADMYLNFLHKKICSPSKCNKLRSVF